MRGDVNNRFMFVWLSCEMVDKKDISTDHVTDLNLCKATLLSSLLFFSLETTIAGEC